MSTFRMKDAVIQRRPGQYLYKVTAGRCESTIKPDDMRAKVEQAKATGYILVEDWLDEDRDTVLHMTDQEIAELAEWVKEQAA